MEILKGKEGSPVDDDRTSILGHCSPDPLEIKTVEGDLCVITQMKESNMALLTTVENLPKPVQDFLGRLNPNTIAVYDKDGEIYVEITLSILRSINCFQTFLLFYHKLLTEFPQLKPYIELFEATEHAKVIPPKGVQVPPNYPKEVWVTKHFYVVVKVTNLILDKLRIALQAKDESFSIPNAVDFLSRHGFSDDELQKTLAVSPRTLYRYRERAGKNVDKLSQSKPPTSPS